MKKFTHLFFLIFTLIIVNSCDKNGSNEPEIILPEIEITDVSQTEGDTGSKVLEVPITLSEVSEEEVSVNYHTEDASAFSNNDYKSTSGTLVFAPGETSKKLEVSILGDSITEAPEFFRIVLDGEQNATFIKAVGEVSIWDTDQILPYSDDDYSTPDSYEGWDLSWSDEFDGTEINTADWSFEIGTGSGDDGWGNHELQYYTDRSDNARLEDGKLIIEAKKESFEGSDYTSSRMITKSKQRFQFGRIDIRAKLPEGQGIWPALWMLGSNIDFVGWPACGEMDIMEMIGNEPEKVHSTVHFGPEWPNNKYFGSPYSLTGEKFIDRFHVFSLVWEQNQLWFYVDDIIIHAVTPGHLSGETYPFNGEFFFIFNVAVGGDWPGFPDDTTVFPQRMEVDYIRVFQKK